MNEKTNGIFYGVGVGPGDPEMITLKAVNVLKTADVIAAPGIDSSDSMAYKIALKAVPEIAEKEFLGLEFPMTRDSEALKKAHLKAAGDIIRFLKEGKNIACLTMGDPTIYSTAMYAAGLVRDAGYQIKIINGITSFCAAAAECGEELVKGKEELHILPASEYLNSKENLNGTYVIMKSGKQISKLKKRLIDEHKSAVMISDCGMDTQKIIRNTENIPEDSGYYSLLIVKQKNS